jgi:hypothetical protein
MRLGYACLGDRTREAQSGFYDDRESTEGGVNVYVQFALAMCAITIIAFAGTAYLAVTFNRRGKTDLAAALAPLADLVDGEADVEEAEVRGRYSGHLVFGRMANASEGPGRVFRADLIDPAGGVAWRLTSDPQKRSSGTPRERLETEDSRLMARLDPDWATLAAGAVEPRTDRYRIEYDPEAGRLRFIRPMRTRRDIPSPEEFKAQLELLVTLGPINRAAQGAPDANWSGGRRGEID